MSFTYPYNPLKQVPRTHGDWVRPEYSNVWFNEKEHKYKAHDPITGKPVGDDLAGVTSSIGSMRDVIGTKLKATSDGNLIPKLTLTRAGDRGTAVHAAIEDRINKRIDSGKWPSPREALKDLEKNFGSRAKNMFEQFLQFEKQVLLKGRDFKIVGAEMQFFSAQHGFAGQMDMVFEIDGKVVILDFKTGAVSESVGQQLSAYEQLVKENIAKYKNVEIEKWVLDISSNNSKWNSKDKFNLKKVTADGDFDKFKAKLDIYKGTKGASNTATEEEAKNILRQKIKDEIWVHGKPQMTWLPQESLTKVDNDLLGFYQEVYAELGYRMDPYKISETAAGEGITHYGTSYKLTKAPFVVPTSRTKTSPFTGPDSSPKTRAVNSTGKTAQGSGIPASSRPVNTIQNQAGLKVDHPKVDMYFDMETSSVERGISERIFDEHGFQRPGSLSSINVRHAHNTVTEYGHITPGGMMSAVIEDFSTSGAPPLSAIENIINKVPVKVNGVSAVGSVVKFRNINNPSEMESVLKNRLGSSGNKYTSSQVASLMQHHGSIESLREMDLKVHPTHGLISEFSEKAASMPAAKRASSITAVGFATSVHKQAEFWGPGGDLETKLRALGIHNRTIENPFVLGSHGTTLDPDMMRRMFSLYNKEFSEVLDKQFMEGAIKTWDTAYGYHQIVRGLGMEDSKFGGKIRLPYNLQTSLVTGAPHEAGRVAKSLDEYMVSTKYNLQNIMDMFNWWNPIKDAIGGTKELHHAAPDAKQTEEIDKLIRNIKEEAQRLSVADSLDGGMVSINKYYGETHMSKLEQDQYFHKAMRKMMGSKGSSLYGATDEKIGLVQNAIKSKIASQNANSVRYAGTPPTKMKSGRFRGGKPRMVDMPHGVSKFFKNGMTSRNAWNFGILGGAAAFMVGSTYLASRDETKTSILKTLGNAVGFKQLSNFSRKYLDIGDPYKDKAPFTHSQMFTKVIPGVTMLAATTYLAGLRRAKMAGNRLGVGAKEATSWMEVIKGAGSTMRLGIREIEENLPITRVFKAGAVLDYMNGARNYGKIAGTDSYKGMGFNIFAEGKASRWKSHTAVDSFIDASRHSSPDAADQLDLFLNSDWRQEGHEKIRVRFTKGEHGETLVFGEAYSKGGAMTRIHESSHAVEANFLELHTGKTRTLEASKKAKEAMQDSIGLSHAQSEAYRQGKYTKIGFSEYLSRMERPDFAKGIMGSVWEAQKWLTYRLEIDAKGINEAENRFYKINEVQGILKQAIVPKKLLGEKFHWLDNLAVKLRFLKPIAEEGILAAGNRFLETPFEAIGVDPRWMKNAGKKLRASQSIVERTAGKALQFIERPHLGLNLHRMKYGAPQYLAEFGVRRLLPAYLAIEGYRALDHLMGKIMFSPTGTPISAAITKPFQAARLAYAKISDITGMTGVSKKQEQFAPGSTSLGFFALPTSAVSVYAVGKSMYKHAPMDLRKVGDAAIAALRTGKPLAMGGRYALKVAPIINNIAANPTLRGALGRGGAKTAGQKILSFMIRNPKLGIFAAAMLPLAPFLPGLVGSGKSYNELKDEYAGKRDVAIRKHRGWLLSSEPVQGSSVDTYRKTFGALNGMDWENKVIWPSYGKRLAHNLTGGLYGRYMLEEFHQRDNPTYQSAPYGAGIPVIGPLIAATVGGIIKPTRTYASTASVNPDRGSIDLDPNNRALAMEMHRKAQSLTINSPHGRNDISSFNVAEEGGIGSQTNKFVKSAQELSGFKGFLSEMAMQGLTGKSRPDQFTPYKQSAQAMYDPSQYMWQYQAGDVSFVGGEFLRRILQSPYKKWEVNDIPNEFAGSSWLPRSMQTGTTFDKTNMGWLYGTKKGWEQLFPEIAGANPESYAPNIKTEILKHVAPHSDEFAKVAQKTAKMAAGNSLSPQQEQRYYETMAQVSKMREKLYVHKEDYAYKMETENTSGNITSFNEEDLTFTLDNYGTREFRLAGITNDINDVRSRLIKQKEYATPEDLDRDAQEIMYNMKSAISKTMAAGNKVNMEIPGGGDFSGREFTEAIVGNLNNSIIDMGAPLANTGNLSSYNMMQDRSVVGSHLLAKYWDSVNTSHTFFAKKLVAERDYLDNYATNRVFNKDVKLWNHPVEHFIKPLISSMASNVGINIIPSFTARRRGTQQYWDVLKYIKYKNLGTEAMHSGNHEEAKGYDQMMKQTMIGINPMKATDEELEMSLPGPERPYFKYFANETNERKRKKIARLVPAAELRLLEALWIRKRVEGGARVDEETQRAYDILQQSKGYLLSEDDMKEYQFETGGTQPLDKYVRQKALTSYLKGHKVPDQMWGGWDKSTNIENVEVHALQEMGEQVQDYGYFETQLRSAAYDKQAYIAASQLNSQILSRSSGIGTILSNVMSQDYDDNSMNMPTTSMMPQSINNIATNAMDKNLLKGGSFYHLIDDAFLLGAKLLRM